MRMIPRGGPAESRGAATADFSKWFIVYGNREASRNTSWMAYAGLRAYDFCECVFVASGAAADHEDDLALVWRGSGGVDRVPRVLSGDAAGWIFLCTRAEHEIWGTNAGADPCGAACGESFCATHPAEEFVEGWGGGRACLAYSGASGSHRRASL